MHSYFCDKCGLFWNTGTHTLLCDPEDPNVDDHDVDVTDYGYAWDGVTPSIGPGVGMGSGSGHSGPNDIVIFPGSGPKILARNFVINVSQMADPKQAKDELWDYLKNNKITTSITITGTKKDLTVAKIRAGIERKGGMKPGKISGFFYNELLVLKRLGFSVTVIEIDSKTNKPRKTTRI